MRAKRSQQLRLGDLIADAFDTAARYSSDPKEVARLATRAIERLLRGASGHGRVRLAHHAR